MRILDKIEVSYKAEIPFVAYRRPGDTVLKFMSQKNKDLIKFKNFNSSGFVFAPFDDKQDAYIICNDIVDEHLIPAKAHINVNNNFPTQNLGKENHIKLVEKAIEKIKTSEVSKIVVSRKEEVSLTEFNISRVFKTLLYQYTNAYVYVWYHPKVGVWMGATPETLLQVSNGEFKTMSLAGTQPFKGELNPQWGSKELEEQQMVSDYIKENLESKVEELEFSEVETVKAGELLHLRTKVKGVLKSVNDVSSLIQLLHPTPAVCGLPKTTSKTFILENEDYYRSFYTGYLGEVNVKNNTSLYVNLRCFNYQNKKASLYVGGGITENSCPEKEWLETVAKSKTIKRVLF